MKRGNIQKDHVGLLPSCLLCQGPRLLSNPTPHMALSSSSDSFFRLRLGHLFFGDAFHPGPPDPPVRPLRPEFHNIPGFFFGSLSLMIKLCDRVINVHLLDSNLRSRKFEFCSLCSPSTDCRPWHSVGTP